MVKAFGIVVDVTMVSTVRGGGRRISRPVTPSHSGDHALVTDDELSLNE